VRVGEINNALNALGWWQLAGVDTLVEEAPCDWLAPAADAATPASKAFPASPAPAPQPASLPATLDAMRALLADDPTFGPAPRDGGAPRLLPEGSPTSGLMLLTGMPEADDAAAGTLFAGRIGLLFDRMLAAIGRDRASIYLSAISPARPAGGRIAPETADACARIALHHVALARPRVLLLMGKEASCAILGADIPETRGRLHRLDQGPDQGEAGVTAVATFHPRLLLQRPSLKAAAWSDLRLALGAMGEVDR